MTRKQILRDPDFRFNIKEFVCPHVYERFGEAAWNYFDIRLLETILWIRKTLGKPMTINNWSAGKTQRGLRCNLCQMVKDKDRAYLSAHVLGQGIDFDVKGMEAADVRQWLKKMLYLCGLFVSVRGVHNTRERLKKVSTTRKHNI